MNLLLKPVESYIKYYIKNRNEITLGINKEDVKLVSNYLFKDLDCDLATIVAMDDRHHGLDFTIKYVFSYKKEDYFFIVETMVNSKIESLTPDIPAANWFEREIHDLFGIEFINHEDPRPLVLYPENFPQNLYPLRKDYKFNYRPEFKTYGKYEYKDVEGDGVFNILVGPIHAGIIEPGHFRFSLAGEYILQLEIRHFWNHRGIEKLAEGKDIWEGLSIVDKISGDHSIAHTIAYLEAVEKILELDIPLKAKYIRVILAELERLMCNINDIGGLFQDIAYSFGSQGMFILKEDIMRLNKLLTGSRFLRNSLTIGGTNIDFDDEKISTLISTLSKIKDGCRFFKDIIASSASILDRFETTGKIKYETIKKLSCTGYIARASGRKSDSRKEHPYLTYKDVRISSQIFEDGDCLARLNVRFSDIEDSLYIIDKMLTELPSGDTKIGLGHAKKGGSSLGYCEGQRGTIYHFLKIDNYGKIDRLRITDPSYNNWQTIQFAVLGDIIADFPLINKSLNLSYAGTSL